MPITNFIRQFRRNLMCLAVMAGVSVGAEAITLTASGSDGNVPQNTLDNNFDTRWSANGKGQWIKYDLGSVRTVDDVSIGFFKGAERSTYFEIQLSTDNNYWTTVFNGVQPNRTNSQQKINVTDSPARYVRIVGQGNTSNDWVSLTEVDITTLGGVQSSSSRSISSISTSSAAASSSPSTLIPAAIYSNFEVEGGNPFVNSTTMVFNALTEKVVTPSGNGWRHELKLIESLRQGMSKNYEQFIADMKVDLSTGGKLIALQYHAEGKGTIVKVYVSDSDESGFLNSIANDGIFDVYVRMKPISGGSEVKYALGTIRSGQTFRLSSTNDKGMMTVSAFSRSSTLQVADGGASYLKFGNYLQSQDPVGGEKCTDFAACYAKFGITLSKVTMSNVVYTRR